MAVIQNCFLWNIVLLKDCWDKHHQYMEDPADFFFKKAFLCWEIKMPFIQHARVPVGKLNFLVGRKGCTLSMGVIQA